MSKAAAVLDAILCGQPVTLSYGVTLESCRSDHGATIVGVRDEDSVVPLDLTLNQFIEAAEHAQIDERVEASAIAQAFARVSSIEAAEHAEFHDS